MEAEIRKLVSRLHDRANAVREELRALYELSPVDAEGMATVITRLAHPEALREHAQEKQKVQRVLSRPQIVAIDDTQRPENHTQQKYDKLRANFLTQYLILKILDNAQMPQSNSSLYEMALQSGLISQNPASFNTRLHRMKSQGYIAWVAESRAQVISITAEGRDKLDKLARDFLRPPELEDVARRVPAAFK